MTDQDEAHQTRNAWNAQARSEGSRERYEARAGKGGSHVIVRRRVSKKQAYAETPAIKIVPQPKSRGLPVGNARLGSPAALLMLAGLVLIYVALHGWDKKYGAFNGAFAGIHNTPQGRAATQPASQPSTSPSRPSTGVNA